MVPSTLRTTSLPPPTISVICPYAIQPMKLMATTQKTGLVISRITRIISGKTPTGACEKGLSLKTTTRKLKRVSTIPIDSAPEQTLSLFNSPKHLGVAYTSEIEKLEKRWAENPKGRNFAPLADAYRKAGELDRAIELCTAGLERHPDYVSAHIVFGRCLIDQKNDPGASAVFRKVLALDPENVLALKILAEIAARGGRYDEAADWLSRLLSADPMNGDAAEALARAKGRATQLTATATPEPVARLVPEAALPPQPNHDMGIQHAPEEPTSPRLDGKGTPARHETFDGTLDFNAVAHSAAKADGIEVQEEVVLKPQDLVVEGLAHTQFESGIFAMPPEAEEDEPKIDLPLIMPDDGLDAAPPPPPAPPVVAETAPPFAAAQRAPAAPGGAASAPPAPPPAAGARAGAHGAAAHAPPSRAG